LIARLQTFVGTDEQVIAGARACAASIRSDCCSSCRFDRDRDSCVLLVRGLNCAVDRWARTVGYRSQYRTAIDVVLADLSITHDTVVLQAVRVKEDLEIILQQLALSCYNFQLLNVRREL